MKSIISSHNKQILTPKNKQVGCNCRVKNSCPLDNKCLTSQLIYQADVTNTLNDEYKYYLGPAETTCKERCSNHKSSFKNENNKNSTELLKHVWSLRENNKTLSMKRKIIKIVYSKATLCFWKLCLTSPRNYRRQKAIAAEIAFQVKIIGGKFLPPSLFSLKYNNKKKL